MDDLIVFWAARLDELEQIATAARDASEWPEIMGDNRRILRNWYGDKLPAATVAHVAANDPKSTLADITADRAVLSLCASVIEDDGGHVRYSDGWSGLQVAKRIAKIRVARFASHPGYKETWKPA